MSRQLTKVFLTKKIGCRLLSTISPVPQVCVIGSGPAGFYTAQTILKKHPTAKVDMYEKSPVPFGLVRFGVAPDHPEVKNVINSFTKFANGFVDRFSFIGNVEVGRDVSFDELRDAYTAIVFAYGASENRKLGILGEDKAVSARKIVGWYNGIEDDSNINLNLDTDIVSIIGHGNVALDVARVLLMSVDDLKKTDITQHAMDVLSKSKVKKVHVIGRRGPMQVSFTIKELREQINLPGCRPVFGYDDFREIVPLIPSLQRPKKRLMELMATTATESAAPSSTSSAASSKVASTKADNRNSEREFHLRFLRSPLEIVGDGHVTSGLKLGINRLQEEDGCVKAVSTGQTEVLPCGMVVTSVGYKSVNLDPQIPFDTEKGIIPNTCGRVHNVKGLYCSGWVKTGPVGVILSTMNDSFDTGHVVCEDLLVEKSSSVDGDDGCQAEKKSGRAAIDPLLKKKGIQTTSFVDWLKIDQVERERGAKVGKPREKIVSSAEMLAIVASERRP